MKPARTFTEKDKEDYAKLKFGVLTSNDSARKWAEGIIEIKSRELYLLEVESWQSWVEKNCPWKVDTMRRALADEAARKMIEETTGEKPDNKKPKRAKAVVSVPESDPVANTQSQDNKTHSSKSIAVKSTKVFDATGYEVHHSIVETWNRRNELDPIAEQIAEFKRFIERMRDENDPIFNKIHQDIILKLKSAVYYLGVAKLEYVCGYCQGKCVFLQQPCANCDSTGLMTKLQWDRLVPEEFKNARRK